MSSKTHLKRPQTTGAVGSSTGFTLVELLVVIAIIGILVALLLPAIQAAREAARRSQCQSNMKQVCLATLNFEQAKGYLPPSKWEEKGPGFGTTIGHSTLSYLLPYVEEQPLADKWSFKVTWDSTTLASGQTTTNAVLNQTPVAFFRCPTAPTERATQTGSGPNITAVANPAAVDYRVCDVMALGTKGDGTKTALQEFLDASPPKVQKRPNSKGQYISVLWNVMDTSGTVPVSQYAKLKQTTDGTSQTMMWFETGGAPVKWKDGSLVPVSQFGTSNSDETQGGDTWANVANWYAVHDHCGDSFFNCNNNEEIYSFHVGGAFFGFGDGSVHYISTDINPDVFVSLFTRDSNDIINNPPF
jgi:prepilin-type N-terminal cleavage/methylation domain-containing protein